MSTVSRLLLGGLASTLLVLTPLTALQAEPQSGAVGVKGTAAPKAGGGGGNAARSAPRSSGQLRSPSGPSGGQRTVTERRRPPSAGVVQSAPRAVDSVRRNRGDGDRAERRNRGGHRGTRYVWGGSDFWFYDGYYHGNCAWLRERWEETGSSYWRRRYRLCRLYD